MYHVSYKSDLLKVNLDLNYIGLRKPHVERKHISKMLFYLCERAALLSYLHVFNKLRLKNSSYQSSSSES